MLDPNPYRLIHIRNRVWRKMRIWKIFAAFTLNADVEKLIWFNKTTVQFIEALSPPSPLPPLSFLLILRFYTKRVESIPLDRFG
jgi:hypothetical protein